jgi:putative protease
MSPRPTVRRPEVLAPAGDDESMRAAIRAGADAVYFGLQGFNARARAKNFDVAQLETTMRSLHEHGVKGYVTLNTLVFESELTSVESAIRACATAGVDAVIVQDIGVARLVRAIAPELPIHASTQMTCTDAGAVEFARSLGASRVILARELSVSEIEAIRQRTDVELEVFVHGALCIAYSGQCLTSEAIGGRSANRGACAQACRLPYELVVDGEPQPVEDRAFLLSPEDLEASAVVPKLVDLGIASLKIEGRLKGPAYVASTTSLYRSAIDAAFVDRGVEVDPSLRETALQMYSRGSGPGFLEGVDHQRLVEARGCDHRGLRVGTVSGTSRSHGRVFVRVKLSAPIARGDGVLVEGGLANEGEVGGRVWTIRKGAVDLERAEAGDEVLVWLGPERGIDHDIPNGRRLFKTNDPAREQEVLARIERSPHRTRIDVTVTGAIGEKPGFEARTERGAVVRVEGDTVVERARNGGQTLDVLRDKLGRLGETPFELGTLDAQLPRDALVPASSINRARRALVERLLEASHRAWATTDVTHAEIAAAALPPDRPPPSAGLFVLCRTLEQAEAAIDAGATGVYLDFLELTGTGNAIRALRARGPVHITLAPPRVRKPGEEKIDRYLDSLAPDALLVRSLGALHDGAGSGVPRIGDFSLNITNRISAAEVLAHDLTAFTPSFDLDATQLTALLDSPFAPFAEVVVHHPMPLFHMEHCVIASLLSSGRDHRDCGRPCEKHRVALRDRAGMEHPVEADVGCRNTVFHAASQSAAGLVGTIARQGVRRFRIELVRERRDDVQRIVTAYRALLTGTHTPQEVWRTLRTESGYGVVRGTLRVLNA